LSYEKGIKCIVNELEKLRKENEQLRSLLSQKDQELADAYQKIKLLEQKVDLLVRRIFGSKSESLDENQLQLLLSGQEPQEEDKAKETQESEEDVALFKKPKPKAPSRRIGVPDNLEVVEQIIQPEVVLENPQQWKKIDEERSRRLDFQPGKFFWQETIRPKYIKIENKQLAPVVAPAPKHVVEGGMAATGLLSEILVNRFGYHLPYYRQEEMFYNRHGVFIARQQMVAWVEQSTRLLWAIIDCLLEELRNSSYAQMDETPIQYQDPNHPGACSQGYLWTAHIPGKLVYFYWRDTRSAQCIHELLGSDFTGRIQCDAYVSYEAYAKSMNGLVILIGCMAHIRRKFVEAKEQDPRIIGWILNQIGWLYHWEEILRTSRAGPGTRMAMRQSHSLMVMDRLEKVFNKIQNRYLPQSSMGKAISYALNVWPNMRRYLDFGEVEIDNNLVENTIRPTAIGKKNWLFMGSDQAGSRNAIVYTLIANCKIHGIEPYTYLKDVLDRLPYCSNQDVGELTPQNWLKNRQIKIRTAA